MKQNNQQSPTPETDAMFIASKRTPGEWEYSKGCTGLSGIFPDQSTSTQAVAMLQLSRFDEKVTLPNAANNAAFIASCAGNAEAGWRATRAAIALLFAMCDGAHSINTVIAAQKMGESILAAFPLELIQKATRRSATSADAYLSSPKFVL